MIRIGRNGRGKTTFLMLLMNRYEYSGIIESSVEFEYFPYGLNDDGGCAIDIMAQICPDAQRWQLERELRLLKVDEDCWYRQLCTLSPGELTKCKLAALFLRENSFLLIDEPTNNLDAAARETVSEYLRHKKGFILVSHDRVFLDSCIDHVLSINRSSIEVQNGNFSTWDENRRMRNEYELDQNARLKKEISRLESSIREKSGWSDAAESRKIGFDPRVTEKSIGRRAYQGAKSKKQMARAKAIESRQTAAIEEKSSLLKDIEKNDAIKLIPLSHRSHRIIELEDVSVSYGGRAVCKHISFSIAPGDRAAICGRNGCGNTII